MTEGRKVGVYARRSKKEEEVEDRFSRSVEDQLTDCRRLIASHDGWVEVKAYVEDGTSAFKKKTVTLADGRRVRRNVRPEWQEMLLDLHYGRIDTLVAYDLDRAMREPRDLEDLIEVVEQSGRYVETVTSSLRLSNDSEVMMARVIASTANKSSRDTSRRVKRAAMSRAEEGRIHGSVASFGYEFQKNAAGKVQQMVINPAEAALVREAADRLLAGETQYGICNDWTSRGIRTRPSKGHPNGSHWMSRTLRRVVTTPTVAGYRIYEGVEYKGQWEPILDEQTWRRLVTFFESAPASNFTTGNRRKYALSGLVKCRTCGNTMVSMTAQAAKRGPSFRCNKAATGGCGKMRVSMDSLEPYVVGRIHAYLSSRDFQRMYDAHKVDGTEVNARTDLARYDRLLAELVDEKDDGLIDANEYRQRRAKIVARQQAAEEAIATVSRDVVLSNLPTPDEFVRLWAEKDNTWRRTIASAVIDKILIASWPGDMTSTIAPRKNESDAAFAKRKAEHNTAAMKDRVVILGHDGKDWPS